MVRSRMQGVTVGCCSYSLHRRTTKIAITLVIIHLSCTSWGIADKPFDHVRCAALVCDPLLKINTGLVCELLTHNANMLKPSFPIVVHAGRRNVFGVPPGRPIDWTGGIVLRFQEVREGLVENIEAKK
jgi:hypothetical protein